MMTRIRRFLLTSLLWVAVANSRGEEVTAPRGPSIIGIDHLPTVVENLEAATTSYRRLGFALKPGRFHANGLRNSHVKFTDGSGVELIAPPARPTDDLARKYSDFLRDGEGPVYLSFHARDLEALTAALDRAGIEHRNAGGLIMLADPHLEFLFFVRDNRSPTDRPEHFAHPNTAVAIAEVWLALDDAGRESLRRLLLALGATESHKTVRVPAEARANVFTVQNGRVVVVPETQQMRPRRPIIGVEFRVLNLATVESVPGTDQPLVPPSAAHGLWVRLAEHP